MINEHNVHRGSGLSLQKKLLRLLVRREASPNISPIARDLASSLSMNGFFVERQYSPVFPPDEEPVQEQTPAPALRESVRYSG